MKNILSIIIGLSLFLGACHSSLSVAHAESPMDMDGFTIEADVGNQGGCKCKIFSSKSVYEKLSSSYEFDQDDAEPDSNDTTAYASYYNDPLPNSSNSFIDDPPNSSLKRQFLFELRTVELNT